MSPRPEIPGSRNHCLMKLAKNGCWGRLEKNMRFDLHVLVRCRKAVAPQDTCQVRRARGQICGSAMTFLGKAVSAAHCALAIRKENALFVFGKMGPDAGACYAVHTMWGFC